MDSKVSPLDGFFFLLDLPCRNESLDQTKQSCHTVFKEEILNLDLTLNFTTKDIQIKKICSWDLKHERHTGQENMHLDLKHERDECNKHIETKKTYEHFKIMHILQVLYHSSKNEIDYFIHE